MLGSISFFLRLGVVVALVAVLCAPCTTGVNGFDLHLLNS
jgi:hypothetical protein